MIRDDDFLSGMDGNDTLDGGDGDDFIATGRGNDIVVVTNDGSCDTVEDFNRRTDSLELNGVTEDDLDFTYDGSGTLMTVGDEGSIYFIGLHATSLDDFILA